MPGFPTDPHLEIVIRCGETNNAATNKYYYLLSAGAITAADIQGVANQFSTLFKAKYCPLLAPRFFFINAKATWRDGTDEFEAIGTGGLVAGTVTTDETLPESSCVVLRRKTNKAGRANRGRVFIPFVPEDFQEASRLVADAIEKYQSLGVLIKSQQTLTGGQVCVPHTPNYKESVFNLVTGVEVVVDVLTRRDRANPRTPEAVAA